MTNSSLSLHNVLYVPSFAYNLLSISKLLQDNPAQVTFLADKCYLQDQNSHQTLEMGSEEHGLYMMTYTHDIINVPTQSHNISIKSDSDKFVVQVHNFDVSQARMGHVPAKILNALHVDFAKIVLNVCDSGYFAKQSRLQFSISNHTTKELFDLVHADL